MRSGLLLAVLGLLLLTAAAQAQETEATWLEVADVALRLRSGPSTDDDVITRLTPREAVELLQRGEQWSQVRRQDGQTGWAHNDYLLPWNELNRPDARRRVGEKRLFRVQDWVNGDLLTVSAELSAVSDHSYVYSHARGRGIRVPAADSLLRLGEQFDERMYHQSLELWDIGQPPAINGDERIVILIVAGFSDDTRTVGWYTGRHALPQEANPNGTGFIGISMSGIGNGVFNVDTDHILGHEFRHLLHHHVGGNSPSWVNEGLAEYSAALLGLGDTSSRDNIASLFLRLSRIQLNLNFCYGGSMLFMAYLHGRLGLEALRDFSAHPLQGLAALDALPALRDSGMDADSFFADWVLANFLLDTRREGGRYGYHTLDWSGLIPPPPRHRVHRLPAGFREATPPYSADYYDLSLPDGEADRLLLDFRLASPPPQDAWLQLVQVLPDRIDVQRFRASDFRDQPVRASLVEQPERVIIAISPFTPSARHRTAPVHYSLALHELPDTLNGRAQVTTALRVRSTPEIADNILGNLQRCSAVHVLERGPQWSLVRNADGLTGWSHNDYLFHLDASASGASGGPCAALSRAAHDGDLATVRRLLASGVPVNGVDFRGRSALHEAAFWGHDNILKLLLAAGANTDLQDAAGITALDEANRMGNSGSVLSLHLAEGNPDFSDPASRSLMLIAAGTGDSALLERFLSRGHDVNWQDADGQTALAAAAANGQEATLRQLLAAGADMQMMDGDGYSPLLLSAANGHMGTLSRLHRAGSSVNPQGPEGHSALTLAAANGHANAVAWLLLGSDADVRRALFSNGRNALHLATAAGHDDVVAQLLLTDIDVTARDADGHDALQLARAAGHDGISELLQVSLSDVLPADKVAATGRTLTVAQPFDFLVAARNGDLAEVDRLINAGVWLDLVDGQGRSALTYAAEAGQRAMVLRLLQAGADPAFAQHQALRNALSAGHDDTSLMLLLANGRPFDSLAWPALSYAAEFGRGNIARLLVDLCNGQPSCVDVRRPWGDFKTPLHHAVIGGHEEIVGLLLNAQADPNAQDEFSAAPLYYANEKKYERIVRRLLDSGANPNTGTEWRRVSSRRAGN